MTGPLPEIRDVHRSYGDGPAGVVALAGSASAWGRVSWWP